MPAFFGHVVATALGKFDNLSCIREGQLLGESGFEVRFQELALPAVPQHEIHVHTKELAIGRRAAAPVFLSSEMWSGQWGLAAAADLACQSHTGC